MHSTSANTSAITRGNDVTSSFVRPRIQTIFLAALAGALLSKLGGLLPGFSPDDYAYAFTNNINLQGTSQGRILGDVIMYLMRWLGVTYTSIQTPAFLLSLGTLSAFIAITIDRVAKKHASSGMILCAAAFAASHPYLSSYYIFRMTYLGDVLLFGSLALAMISLTSQRFGFSKKVLICVSMLVLGSNVNQLALLMFFVAALAWACVEACQNTGSEEAFAGRKPFILVGVIVLTSIITYLLVGILVRHLLGVAPYAEYNPHMNGGIRGVVISALSLSRGVLFTSEAIFPSFLKWLCLALVAYGWLCASLSKTRWGIVALVVFLIGTLASISPMALSWGGHVPRTFSTIGLVFALSFVLAANGMATTGHRLCKTAMILCVCLFSLLSGTMFFQNAQLTRWDQERAAAIYHDAANLGLLHKESILHIVSAWPHYQQPISMFEYGINESSFTYPWAYTDLFSIATGSVIKVTDGNKETCIGKPKWPDPGSVFLIQINDVYACL